MGDGGHDFTKAVKELTRRIQFNVKFGDFTYCGKNVQSDDFTIRVGQADACHAVDPPVVSASRRATPNEPLTPEEITEPRSMINSLNWLARQTRPDLSFVVSALAQSIRESRVKHLILAQKACARAQDNAEFELVFHANTDLDIEVSDIFVSFDASQGNMDSQFGEKTKSQAGYVVGLCNKAVLEGDDEKARIAAAEHYSGAVKRVCRSSLASEANAALEGIEAGFYFRSVLDEITGRGIRPKEKGGGRQLHAFTDSRSLE